MENEMSKLKVIRVQPNRKAELVEIENTLESFQHEVGGYIECVYPFADPVAIVCNDEGKLDGLDLNRSLISDGKIYDIIAGTFIVVGLTEDDFDSIPEELIDKYMEMYRYPEFFLPIDGKVLVYEVDEDERVRAKGEIS